jgi:hypothetical protein
MGGELRALFAAYVEAKQRQHVLDYDDLLLYWAQMHGDRRSRARSARASITCSSTSTRTPTAAGAILLRAEADGAGSPWSATTRRRSIVPRRDGAQHPRLPAQFDPPRAS